MVTLESAAAGSRAAAPGRRPAVEVAHLRKTYGTLVAVDDVSAVQAIQGSVQTGFPPVTPLLVLAGYTLVFAYLARRFFRWE